MKTIGMEVVSSSMLKAIGYDESDQTVSVQFKNGDVWHYFGVDKETYDHVRVAPSIGHAFIQYIRDAGFTAEKQ